MTEDQKAMGVILEVLAASRRVPRTWGWVAGELRLAGRRAPDVPGLLERMEAAGLVAAAADDLGVRRWEVTARGLEALADL